ncbi:MAG TPA: Gfo/Idh/MocA family oxidoreductase, partial [Gemmataceae bacterium]|nr:Gfo/Idh/MocA family oxidoreductase [Gemmataceae bacterium]
GPCKLVAMADVFKDRQESSYKNLAGDDKIGKMVEVPPDRRFIGFDAYKKAMDCLNPGDIVILTTPPAFRWVHFTYAIDKGLNVFMEKPVAVDGAAAKRMFALADAANKKNLKVGVGLMCRHSPARAELYQRIRDGAIGELTLLRAYRMMGPEASCFSGVKPANMDELEYQIRRFHSFLWASGGCYSDFLIHHIDECCWMKDAFPIMASATGGRHYRELNGVPQIDQNFDHYAVEYTYKDGTKLLLQGRTMPNCSQLFASYGIGSKGSCVISEASHAPARVRTYKGFDVTNKEDITWRYNNGKDEGNPYDIEWDDLLDAIRNNKPYNEAPRGTEASLVTAMGRIAAHTGQVVKRDDYLNKCVEMAPDVDKLTIGGAAPVLADKDGKYPVPQPGIVKTKEYEPFKA